MFEYFIVVLVCLVLSAFFSGSETALLRINPDDLDAKAKAKEKGSQGLSLAATAALLSSPSKLLVTILLGNNIVNILGTACASILAVHYFGDKNGVAVATAVMTVAVLIFSEILPKAVASRAPLGVSLFVALPCWRYHLLRVIPLEGFFNKLGRIPNIGDTVKAGEFEIKVVDMAGSRIS